MPSVHVIGSVNLDLVASVERLPGPGETIGGAELARHPGGKGANQALAAARMGAEVTFTAAVGDDAGPALALLRAEPGLTLRLSERPVPTGVALIAVDPTGENQIVVAPGANDHLTVDHLPTTPADATLAQLEVPRPVVAAALVAATGLRCLNAAPADEGAAALLDHCDVLIVNESERTTLGDSVARFTGLLVTTLGAAGAVAHRGGREVARAAPPPVTPVDAVGAGDAFCGALVTELSAGSDLTRALDLAVTAGALATEVPGAQPSLPTRAAVEARCPSRS